MSFYVFECEKCRRWKVKELRFLSSAKIKCGSCLKVSKVAERGRGIVLKYAGPYEDQAKAMRICSQMNAKQDEIIAKLEARGKK